MNPIIYADMHEHRLGLSFIAAQYDDTGIEAMLDQSNTIDFTSPDELDALATHTPAHHNLTEPPWGNESLTHHQQGHRETRPPCRQG